MKVNFGMQIWQLYLKLLQTKSSANIVCNFRKRIVCTGINNHLKGVIIIGFSSDANFKIYEVSEAETRREKCVSLFRC